MIVAGSASPLLLSSAGGYNLTNSLRFRSSASAYLNRTPASASNRTTWTWSAWVKRGDVASNDNRLFGAGTSNSDRALIAIENYISFVGTNSGSNVLVLQTTPVYRDPSAWYHIVIALDTTQATASNRAKIYVNGVQVTAFGTATYPAQNTTLQVNSANPHVIGTRGTYSVDSNFDGYLAEVNFIDGQALTPSSFGQTSATTGVWIPKKYTGTYGTNGFYLPFTDNSALTTSSNVGLGKDFSGNANYWTTNNISITSGTTYDSMTDVPTLTSATTANYAVLNPLNKIYSTFTLSDGNLNWTSDTVNMGAFGTMQLPTSGKYYWEIVMTVSAGGSPQIGVGGGTASLGDLGAYYRSNGNKEQYGGVSGNGSSAYGATWTTNDVIGIAYDADTSSGQITFYKNNSSQGVAFSSLKTNFPNGLFPVFQNNASGTTTFQANFGQRPFTYTPPTGFNRLNTFNLPTPTIGATASTTANKYMDATTYTGNGSSSQVVTNSGSMQPDFVWIKSRNQAFGHLLFDSVRGISLYLQSNSTGAEVTDVNMVSSFNSNGFTVGSSGFTNGNTYTQVGWQWRASNATAVTNTSGTITSTVSANTTAGFSIVTYTGNGTGGATIGHGLGIAPKMYIVKNRNSGGTYWGVYHTSIPASQAVYLNVNSAASTNTALWNSTAPTSSVFSVGTSSDSNESGWTYVAYCFAQVAGYSAFGSYTGNGSSDGPFVFTGFRPRYVIAKCSGTTGPWNIFDSARGTYNVNTPDLWANSSNAETGNNIDFLSNGFKVRDGGGDLNASSQGFIYMAFAESPFKYANAR